MLEFWVFPVNVCKRTNKYSQTQEKYANTPIRQHKNEDPQLQIFLTVILDPSKTSKAL